MKIIVFVIMEEVGIDKWKKIFLGINFIVIFELSKDIEEVKKLLYVVSKGGLVCF